MKTLTGTLRIVVADNSAIIRTGLVATLKRLAGAHAAVQEVSSTESLKSCLALQHPNVVLVNPMFDGLFDVRAFIDDNREYGTRFVAIVATMLPDNVLRLYDAHFSINDSIETIYDSIRRLFGENAEDETGDREPLSDREIEIVTCVAKGLTNKEIADTLCLSIHTVITHRRNISRKLQIHSTAGLTIYAISNKLVDINDVKA